MTARITGAFIIVICGMLTGMSMAQRERLAVSSTERAILFLVTVRQRLSYSAMRTEELLQSVCEEIYGESKNGVFETAGKNLREEDRKILFSAFNTVGRFDIMTQESQLSELTSRLAFSLEELRRELSERQRLKFTLGTMAGLCMAVFLI